MYSSNTEHSTIIPWAHPLYSRTKHSTGNTSIAPPHISARIVVHLSKNERTVQTLSNKSLHKDYALMSVLELIKISQHANEASKYYEAGE